MPAKQTQPIDLYFWPTPNGHFIHIGKGEQFAPEFLRISPNNRIPAIVDPEGPDGQPISVFESGAILLYLAEKFGRFHGRNPRERVAVNEWLMWQMGGVGPMFGQQNHFRNYAPEKLPYAITRYANEVHRLYRVLNRQLDGRAYVAGDYSIADMSLIGWVRGWKNRDIDIAEFPNFAAWLERVEARPAVQRGLALKAPPAPEVPKEEQAKVLYGQR
jgi:GST-like protein